MSTTQTETVELTANSHDTDPTILESADNFHGSDGDVPSSAVEAIPDGGYGWTVVFACSAVTFMINGWSGSWGFCRQLSSKLTRTENPPLRCLLSEPSISHSVSPLDLLVSDYLNLLVRVTVCCWEFL